MEEKQRNRRRISVSRPGDLVGSFALSYLIGAILYVALIYFAGVWNVLTITRLLNPLIDGGVVQLHDHQVGPIEGVPDYEKYYAAQDPIEWYLLGVAFLLLLVFWGVKALQFHTVARFCGIEGRSGPHARAYLYGEGINRLMPFNVGDVGTALVLEGQGASLRSASSAVLISKLFVMLEILGAAVVGLIFLGWSTWLSQIFWALVIFGVLFLFLNPRDVEVAGWPPRRTLLDLGRAFARRPLLLAKLLGLSIVSLTALHVAAYLIAMAFTTANVILGIEYSVVLMGLVGGYVARLIPLTPGGHGQFEWGFAAAILIAGSGFPEAATFAILVGVGLFLSSLVLDLVVRLFYGVETDTAAVLAAFSEGTADEEPPAPVVLGPALAGA